MGEGLVLDADFEALGAVGEGVERGRGKLGGDGCGDGEVLLEAFGVDEFELVVELIVEVAGFEDELLVEDVLVDAEVVGAGSLRSDGVDVVGGDGGGVAALLEFGVEAGELGFEAGLLHAGGDVGAEAGATEDAAAWTDGGVGESDAGVPAIP